MTFNRPSHIRRIMHLVDQSAWVPNDGSVDSHSVAADIFVRMMDDGHAPETITPLAFAGEYGSTRLFDLIAESRTYEGGEPEAPGDIYDTPTGIAIVTDTGLFHRTHEEALGLIQGLAQMLRHTLTLPWSADDSSTILSRGRELRRPSDQTEQLSGIADFHA